MEARTFEYFPNGQLGLVAHATTPHHRVGTENLPDNDDRTLIDQLLIRRHDDGRR